jgi:hypothetical protein
MCLSMPWALGVTAVENRSSKMQCHWGLTWPAFRLNTNLTNELWLGDCPRQKPQQACVFHLGISLLSWSWDLRHRLDTPVRVNAVSGCDLQYESFLPWEGIPKVDCMVYTKSHNSELTESGQRIMLCSIIVLAEEVIVPIAHSTMLAWWWALTPEKVWVMPSSCAIQLQNSLTLKGALLVCTEWMQMPFSLASCTITHIAWMVLP